MANSVARTLAGSAGPQMGVPWFWSEQYDLKLQTIGLSAGHDASLVRGDPDGRTFSVIYLRAGAIVALDCVNSTQDYVQGRALVLAGAQVAPALLADTLRPLKTFALTRP